jgi:hypothetical protein
MDESTLVSESSIQSSSVFESSIESTSVSELLDQVFLMFKYTPMDRKRKEEQRCVSLT